MSATKRVSLYIFFIVFVLTNMFVIHTVFLKVSTFELLEKSQVQVIKNVYEEFPDRVYAIINEQFHDLLSDEYAVNAFIHGNRKLFDLFAERYYDKFSSISDGAAVNILIHDKDGNVFYRFHDPSNFGDSQIGERPMVRDAFTKREIQKGFEVGSNGLFHRVIYPVTVDGEFLGLFEFGVEVSLFASWINTIADIKTSLMVKAANIKDFKNFHYYDMNGDEYMVFNNDHELFSRLKGRSLNNKYYVYKGHYYTIIKGFQLKGFQGDDIGEFIFVSDRTELMHWIYRYVMHVAVFFILSLVLIYYVVRTKIKPLVSEVENHYLEANRELEEINRELEQRVWNEIERNRRSEEVLHNRNKLADMGRMISALAHHWRQPLNALGLYVQDAAACAREKSCTKEYIDEFEKNSMDMISQLSDTIDDFRIFFKNKSDDDDSFEIILALLNMLRLMKSQLDNHHISMRIRCLCSELDFESGEIEEDEKCHCGRTVVRGFKGDFKHVILSIVSNAIDAVNENRQSGGVIKGEIFVQVSEGKDMVHISISDNGGGIKGDVAKNIFDPYYSTKQEGKGAGLGLYMSKVIIEQQFNGEITFENINNGAKFIISIPLVKQSD